MDFHVHIQDDYKNNNNYFNHCIYKIIQQSLFLFEHDVFKMTSTIAQVEACPPPQLFRKKQVLAIARFCAASCIFSGNISVSTEENFLAGRDISRIHNVAKKSCFLVCFTLFHRLFYQTQ
jgi:hypothetical protein